MKHVNYDEAIELMEELHKTTDDVSVFVDRGWPDSGIKPEDAEITIITDGHGQKPHASMTYETFKNLRDNEVIGPNNLRTFKARKNHQYKWEAYKAVR